MEEMIHFRLWLVKTRKQSKFIDPVNSVYRPSEIHGPWLGTAGSEVCGRPWQLTHCSGIEER